MKALLLTSLLFVATLVGAGEAPAAIPPVTGAVKGEVLEVKDVEAYTYLRLKTKDGETWAAVAKATVKKGAEVTIENVMVMNNFESKSLKQTFPTILFGSLGGAAGGMAAGPAGHGGAPKPEVDTSNIKVAKAVGPNAHTVAEILAKGAALKDKPVLVRGKIVKYNEGIMGKNWIHLRDGTGSEKSANNDVLVTTTNQAKPGDLVTVKGVVRTDKDFGSGYAYKVMIEDATLQQ
jgi:hypothetical protein